MPLLILAVFLLAAAAYLVSEVVTHPAANAAPRSGGPPPMAASALPVRASNAFTSASGCSSPRRRPWRGFALRLNPESRWRTSRSGCWRPGWAGPSPRRCSSPPRARSDRRRPRRLPIGMAFVGATLGFLLAFGLAAVGFIVPGFFVSRRARARREEMRAQLPDALDLLAVRSRPASPSTARLPS